MSKVKHTRSSARLRRGLAVSTAALVLPVLGAAPALAAGGGQPAEQANEQAAGGGNGKAQGHGDGQGQGKAKGHETADAGTEQGSAEQGGAEQASAEQAGDQQAGDQQAQAPEQKSAPSQESPGNRPTQEGSDNNANASGNGANASGPYDSQDTETVDEGGQVQGSRGKADDKNPPGQVGNTRDNGYECDGNSGIGDGPNDAPGSKEPNGRGGASTGNPAHTGCDTPQEPEEPEGPKPENPNKPETPDSPNNPNNPNPVVPGDTTPTTVTPGTSTPSTPGSPVQAERAEVLDNTVVRPAPQDGVTALAAVRAAVTPQALTTAAAPRPTVSSPTSLPFTGDGTGLVALLAVSSLTVGGGMVLVGRRQSA